MLKFWFFRLSRGWKGKKWPEMLKISVCHTLYFSNHRSYDLHLWYTCNYQKIIPPGIFFIVFKIWIFRTIWGRGLVKGQKMVQYNKKFCLLYLVAQEPYIIWLSFMLHLCKMKMSPGNFSIFWKFLLFGLLREGGGGGG